MDEAEEALVKLRGPHCHLKMQLKVALVIFLSDGGTDNVFTSFSTSKEGRK